eukprot:TRINITY_DN2151_c0_g1_i1.p1 TRINITY_DN2151_c0_g1~~TRINITY_DN2151_c0_g1_i1.p1  ORF type:complete len:115 (+),score=6.89 TRINITY_DN2151_c0_g1_i1:73-417(+)
MCSSGPEQRVLPAKLRGFCSASAMSGCRSVSKASSVIVASMPTKLVANSSIGCSRCTGSYCSLWMSLTSSKVIPCNAASGSVGQVELSPVCTLALFFTETHLLPTWSNAPSVPY